jgi:hypothetical protein
MKSMKMRTKFGNWKLYTPLFLTLISIASIYGIETFDGKEIWVWVFLGIPISIVSTNYLNYREYKRLKERVSREQLRRSFLFSTLIGLFLSVLSTGFAELGNAAIPIENIKEDVVLVCKWRSGSKRSSWISKFKSVDGSGHVEIEVSKRVFDDLNYNTVYRIGYKKGLFGWKYKVGSLDYQSVRAVKNEKCR